MQDTNETFWLVWTPQGGDPMRCHKSGAAAAAAEAARLATRYPEKTFYTLRAVERFAVAEPPITVTQLTSPAEREAGQTEQKGLSCGRC